MPKLLELENEKVTQKILEKFERTEKDIEDYVKILKDWLKTQKHLPQLHSDQMLKNYLILSKFGIEKTKSKLDMHYTIKTLLPEFFENMNPKYDHMKEMMDLAYILPLPKLSPDLARTFVFRVNECCTGDQFDTYKMVGQVINMALIILHEDFAMSFELIYDLTHFTARQASQITPMFMKKVMLLFEKAISNRLSSLHVVNLDPKYEFVINVVMPFFPKKIASRLKFHQNMEDLLNYYPKETLPVELGGTEISLKEINEMWKKKFDEWKETFDIIENVKIDESLRPTPLVNDEILGFHGNFKKLNFD